MKERQGSEPHFTVLYNGGKMTQVDFFLSNYVDGLKVHSEVLGKIF